MLKKVLCVSLSIFILFGVCGCMKYKNKSVTDAALEYMEKKYGEPFTYAAPWGESYSGTHQLMVTCESLTGRVLVEIENYREEGEVFRDNYIAVKYAQETLDLFQSYVDQEFGEGRVFYEVNPRGLSEDLPADATLEEYLADSRAPLAKFVEVS